MLHKAGITPFNVSATVILIGFGLSIIVAFSAVGTLFVSVLRRQPFGLFTMFIAFVICFVLSGYAAIVFNKTSTNPVLYNVSTDLIDPPGFSQNTLDLRGEDANTVDFDSATIELHRNGYADLKPLIVNAGPELTFNQTLDLVQERGWEIITMDPQLGLIEATATTFWMGFKDDVVIRVQSSDDNIGSTIDMRSVSRIGATDLGTNAKRIREFFADLQETFPGSSTSED